MDGFGFTEEIGLLRDSVRRFVDDEVVPVEQGALELDNADVLAGLMARAKEAGLWALGHPEDIGGGGLPFLAYVYVNEVIGRSPPAVAAFGTHTLQDALMLRRFGTEEQRERWLTPLVQGEIFSSIGMTEPEVAGSDPKLMRSGAVQDGDDWLIDAHKWFVSWADRSAFTTVLAKTDPVAPLHRQFSAFLVPTDTPGYTVERLIPLMGDTTSHYGEIRLEKVRVPSTHLLGERGQGFAIAQARLQPARVFDCMQWLGQAERAFELMCGWANIRHAHGSLLRDKGEIERYVAESAAQIQSARLMTLDTARIMDEDGEARVETSMVKFHTARMLQDVIDRSIQVHGAAGLTADLPLERMYRDARSASIYDGPDEVHRMLVAREFLDDLERTAPWT
ncbi:MAG: acyl-CoA dehydrogenase [Nitriliruptor sp.]|nr:MAG: acyl-CoA dehydrogenase [Nitriliruptor sp.]